MLHAVVAPSLPASGVTHSVVGRFSEALPDGRSELCVFKKNNLELWRIQLESDGEFSRLSYVTSFQLNAPPLCVATCRPPGFAVDVIALCFDDFHVSFVQYDPLLMRFHTLMLVQLDEREVVHDVTPLDPIMRADPTGRFIAVLARRRHMFLLPLLGKDVPGGTGDVYDDKDPEKMQTQKNTNEIKPTVPADDWGDEDDYIELSMQEKDKEKMDRKEESHASTAVAENGATKAQQGEAHDSSVIGGLKGLMRVGVISMFTLATAIKGSVRYVRDMQFIDSLGEPILAILCERQPTWAGRVKIVEWRTKTVESNMLSQRVVWTQISAASTADPKLLLIGEVDDVPYNVTHMTPVGPFSQVPSGVICHGANTVMHVTTKRGYGVYFNNNGMDECASSKSMAVSFGKAGWSDAKMENSTALVKVNLSLANCAAAPLFAAKEEMQVLAVSEEDGVVLTLHFTAQGAGVQGVKITILGSGCHCSSISLISSQLAFLGSACGNSCVALIDALNSDVLKRFQLVESMEAIGYIADMDAVECTMETAGEVGIQNAGKAFWLDNTPYAELLHNTALETMPNIPIMARRSVMDLAICAGRDGSGSLFVLRQSVRNTVVRRERINAISAFYLEVLQNPRWSAAEGDNEGATRMTSNALPHLLLTGLSFTIPFAVRGDSVQHLRCSEFLVSSRTVFAVGVSWLNALLQVTEREGRIISPDGRVLFHRFHFISERDVEKHRQAKAACLTEELKLLFLLLEDGTLLQFTLKAARAAPKREVFAEGVTAFTLWREKRRVITFTADGTMVITDMQSRTTHATFPLIGTLPPHSILDASDMPKGESRSGEELSPVAHVEVVTLSNATVAGENEMMIRVENKRSKNENLWEQRGSVAAPEKEEEVALVGGEEEEGEEEVRGGRQEHDVGDEKEGGVATALIIILATGELAVYQIISPDAFGPLRLIKSIHHLLDSKAEREVIESIEMKKQRLQQERMIIKNDTQLMRHCSQCIIPFNSIGGNSGAYVCGQHPLFLFWDHHRCKLVAYRHQTPGPVRGFVPFRPMKNGYICCHEGFVDFATMDTYCTPNGHGWLTRHVHLGVTPHFVVYNPPARCCFVTTSQREPFRVKRASFDVQLKIRYDEEYGGIQSSAAEVPACNMPPIAPDAGVRVPVVERFEIRLLSTADWTCKDTLHMEENEQVLAAQAVEIHCERDDEGNATAPVCVVTTAFPLGEDVTCRGRVLILTSRMVRSTRRIILLHSEPLNGPATAITEIRNHIAVAVGGTIKLFRYDWVARKLVVGALLYAGIYVTKMSAFRNYLIYGDLYQSCTLARFNEKNHTLTVLGKDRNSVSTVHCNMLYHDRAFGILCSDDQRNLLVMGYTPRVQQTEVGVSGKVLESVLSLDGEYRLPSGCLVKSLRFRSLAGNSSVTLYATNYGEIGFIVPIGEQANRTALWVGRRLQMDLPHVAGLTPRMFLGLNQGLPKTALRAKEMLVSFSLLKQFFFLDVCSRKTIATAAYTQLERVTNLAALVYEECTLF